MSHTLWFCEYHIVWIPKYRYRVLRGKLKEEVECSIREQSRQMEIEVLELNVQEDHVHLVALVRIPAFVGHLIRFIPDSDSDSVRTGNPVHIGHPIRSLSDRHSD